MFSKETIVFDETNKSNKSNKAKKNIFNIKNILCCFDNIKNNTITNNQILKNKNILIVDDNDINIKIVKNFLHILNVEKKNIMCANNGHIALKICNKYIFDIIISDIEMPECNGIEMVNKLKSNKENINHNVPIIFMSASDNEMILNDITKMNIPFLSKPINKNMLHLLLIDIISNTDTQSNIDIISSTDTQSSNNLFFKL